MYTLFGRSGWGSVLVEAQLAFYRLPYEIEEVDDLFRSAEARARASPRSIRWRNCRPCCCRTGRS